MYYYQLFNPQYVNEEYFRQMQWQQRDVEQRQEIMKAVKAIHEYCEAMRKIDPEYQQLGLNACIAAVFEEMCKG